MKPIFQRLRRTDSETSQKTMELIFRDFEDIIHKLLVIEKLFLQRFWSVSMQNLCFAWRNQVLLALSPETDEIMSRCLDVMTFWPWLQKSMKAFPEVSISWLCGHGSRSRQNRFQKYWFNDSLALVLEIDKIMPRRLDFMTLWPWLQKSTKSRAEASISWFPGYGKTWFSLVTSMFCMRTHQNPSNNYIFNDLQFLDWFIKVFEK